VGTLASQAESGVWVQAPSARFRGYLFRKHFEIVHAMVCNLVHLVREMVRNAVHNAFLNTLTVGTSAFHQWERRSHAFPLEMNPGVFIRTFQFDDVVRQ